MTTTRAIMWGSVAALGCLTAASLGMTFAALTLGHIGKGLVLGTSSYGLLRGLIDLFGHVLATGPGRV